MERFQVNALRAMRKQYVKIIEENDARKNRVITGAYRGMENREFTMQGLKLVHNVRGEVLALGTKTEKLQEKLDQYSSLLELDEVSEEDKTIVRTFTSALQKRIENLEYMRENNIREVLGVNKDIIRTRIQEYSNEIAGVSEEQRNSSEYYRLADVLPELEDILAKSKKDLEYVSSRDLNARLRIHRAKRDELLVKRDELLRNEQGKNLNNAQEEIVVLEEGVEAPGMPSKEKVLSEVAKREGIDPSELEIVWDGADGEIFDDSVGTPFKIIRRIRQQDDSDKEKSKTDTEELTKIEEELRKEKNTIEELEELTKLKEKFKVKARVKKSKGSKGSKDSKDPIVPIDPTNPKGPKGSKDPKDPIVPIDPTNPKNPKGSKDPKDPIVPIDPTNPKKPKGSKDPKDPIVPIDPTNPKKSKGSKDPTNPKGPKGSKSPKGPILNPSGGEISIPDDPTIGIDLDEEKIKKEYKRLKNDMYAKYYGDRDYKEEYNEIAARYREHEITVVDEDGRALYRTIENYSKRKEDEKFLLLDGYKDALERSTKYENGDKTVYEGTEKEIITQYKADKVYVETRNHTFNQHKNTQKDLATLGKYGEKMPYIPKQDNLIKNIGRGILNTSIFLRNVVAPIYRVAGRFVAQPFHRLVTGGRDGSPYNNNFYHRYVARREYFAQEAQEKDLLETKHRQEEAKPDEIVKPVKHPIRNWFASRLNALVKSKEGNNAVLNAGEYDIKTDIYEREHKKATVDAYDRLAELYNRQAEELEKALTKNPKAINADKVKAAIDAKRKAADEALALADYSEKSIGTQKQTDAVSDRQHAIASKEVNTARVTVIKGFVKGLTAKYVGPKIEQWVMEHSKIKKNVETIVQEPVEEQIWIEPTYREVTQPVNGPGFSNNSTIEDLMRQNNEKIYTGYETVSGGESNPATYTFNGDERITSIWADNGTQWGTGFSDKAGLQAPLLTDKSFDTSLLDSNGVLRQDITPQQLIEACELQGIDPNKLYVSIGDMHWVKATDVFSLEQVRVGETVTKVVDVPGHMETIVKMVDKVEHQIQEVDNPRLIGLIQGGNVVARKALKADAIQDVAENLRNTHTNVKENKQQPRRYDMTPLEPHPTSKFEYEKMKYKSSLDDDER